MPMSKLGVAKIGKFPFAISNLDLCDRFIEIFLPICIPSDNGDASNLEFINRLGIVGNDFPSRCCIGKEVIRTRDILEIIGLALNYFLFSVD